jgi:hypothetical protein
LFDRDKTLTKVQIVNRATYNTIAIPEEKNFPEMAHAHANSAAKFWFSHHPNPNSHDRDQSKESCPQTAERKKDQLTRCGLNSASPNLLRP